jgi:chemosensory pili system protein ChpA (sensor histidine kinase/response regulator)
MRIRRLVSHFMKTILLAEDDSFIVDIYANQLKKAGYQVEIATDGDAVLEKIQNHIPDLLLLDIGLPKKDGWEVMRELRGDPKTENLKVMVISNMNKENYADDIAHFNIIKYFVKIETTVEEIITAVKELLT